MTNDDEKLREIKIRYATALVQLENSKLPMFTRRHIYVALTYVFGDVLDDEKE